MNHKKPGIPAEMNTPSKKEPIPPLSRDVKTRQPDTRYLGKQADIFDYIKENVDYAKDLAKHKYYVYKAGRQLDLPRMQLLKHDWNKLDPLVFTTYRDFFYGPDGVKGKRDPLLHRRFKTAAELHKVYSPHHVYTVGIDEFDRRKNKMEAVADWWSASKRRAGYSEDFPEFKPWWNKVKYALKPRIGNRIFKMVDYKLNKESK